ncbi:hypothetical protein CHS0354_011405 [Potamilus streckersoni]|uniref:Uncharacterized protein n=1 Tax=Potamilus streckersoni TaxID=2493646 RepID=A0AAE0TH00_9BIVA|nr:hypothetical protein CHS0354_011405 [Potamilus streckersoni]
MLWTQRISRFRTALKWKIVVTSKPRKTKNTSAQESKTSNTQIVGFYKCFVAADGGRQILYGERHVAGKYWMITSLLESRSHTYSANYTSERSCGRTCSPKEAYHKAVPLYRVKGAKDSPENISIPMVRKDDVLNNAGAPILALTLGPIQGPLSKSTTIHIGFCLLGEDTEPADSCKSCPRRVRKYHRRAPWAFLQYGCLLSGVFERYPPQIYTKHTGPRPVQVGSLLNMAKASCNTAESHSQLVHMGNFSSEIVERDSPGKPHPTAISNAYLHTVIRGALLFKWVRGGYELTINKARN